MAGSASVRSEIVVTAGGTARARETSAAIVETGTGAVFRMSKLLLRHSGRRLRSVSGVTESQLIVIAAGAKAAERAARRKDVTMKMGRRRVPARRPRKLSPARPPSKLLVRLQRRPLHSETKKSVTAARPINLGTAAVQVNGNGSGVSLQAPCLTPPSTIGGGVRAEF